MKKLKKPLLITDLHFGKAKNSDEHNETILRFFDHVIENMNDCDSIICLGDIFESRSALGISTINYALEGFERLNALNVPIYLIVGNHDSYTRHDRKIHSLKIFENFSNVTVIDQITLCEDFIEPILLCPWLFPEEYEQLLGYDVNYVFGHFEINTFIISNSSTVMEHGMDPELFYKFKRAFSGHFHRKQSFKNIEYIGNIFAMSFNDQNDENRGYSTFNILDNDLQFFPWVNGPKYLKVNLSDILDNTVTIPDNCNCKIISDVALEYTELMEVKKQLMEDKTKLSLIIEEQPVKYYNESEEIEDTQAISINDAILEMIHTIQSKDINTKLLAKIYNGL